MDDVAALRRTLFAMCVVFAVSVVALTVAAAFIVDDLEGDPTAGVTIGYLIVGGLAVAGLGLSVAWRGRAAEQPVTPGTLRTSFLVTIALAEMAPLVGFVWAFLSHDSGPLLAGTAAFLLATAVMASGVSAADIQP